MIEVIDDTFTFTLNVIEVPKPPAFPTELALLAIAAIALAEKEKGG